MFLLRKVATAGVLLVVVTLATFVLLNHVQDPTRAILGPRATAEQLAAKRGELGLDQSMPHRYADWIHGLAGGDLGVSWFTGLPVSDTIGAALPITATLTVAATMLAALLGVAIGTLAASRRGWVDKLLQAVSSVAFSVPAVWLALLLVIAFAIQLHWLPATGYVPFAESPAAWLRSIILPVIALAPGSVAAIANQTRSDVETILDLDYVRTLRGRGLPTWRLVSRHLLRNAAPNTVTIIGLQFITLFGSAFVVEEIFAMHGLGVVSADSALRADIPVVLGVVLTGTVLIVAVNSAVDLVNGLLDPKERLR